ncbi:MAG: hypothetical protein CME32_11495 [Gimesia sp.]|nr:hypothetical protein [Gimesia sp.]
MISSQLDFSKPLTYIRYGRMSNPSQNPSSPDQQFATVDLTLKRSGYNHWKHLGDYRDDGISGRLLRKRLGYQRMLFDIKSGAVSPDLILVDDIDRFGRVDDLKEIRRDLCNKYGVLILDAKSNFGDPNTPQGRIYNSVEEIRAVEEGKTKAHRVFRGKRDAILLGRWPGGKPPFGYQLETRQENANGHSHSYSIIVPEPQTANTIKLLFQKADETGWGQDRLAKFLNNHEDVPDHQKPFHGSTVGSWLDHEIYIGKMVWPKTSTDIISDCHVIEKVPTEEQLCIDGYCDPIVDRDVFERIGKIRKIRGDLRRAVQTKDLPQSEKQIKAPAPGMTLRYLLTGLVRCGHCNRSMVPSRGGSYVTKNNETREYTAYACPGYKSGICSNNKTIPEKWLRQMVIDAIKSRLFTSSCDL